MDNVFTPNGLIGRSGKFYSCEFTKHREVSVPDFDAPYAVIHCNMAGVYVAFDAYYTCDPVLPNDNQYETLMDYCTEYGELFEDMTDCWNLPWKKWRTDD